MRKREGGGGGGGGKESRMESVRDESKSAASFQHVIMDSKGLLGLPHVHMAWQSGFDTLSFCCKMAEFDI